MHEMHLFAENFEKVRSDRKTIDPRLYDEKRRKIRIGDEIVFSKLPDGKERMTARVVGLSIFGSFRDLYSAFDRSKFGYAKNTSLEDMIADVRRIYPEEKERASGVVGIHIKLV